MGADNKAARLADQRTEQRNAKNTSRLSGRIEYSRCDAQARLLYAAKQG